MFGLYGSPEVAGGRHESTLEGYSENIESKDLTKFEYYGNEFTLCANKEDDMTKISCTGGGKYSKRDGSYFIVRYEIKDDSIFKEIQDIVEKYNLTKGNGYCLHVDGLPAGIGDRLEAEYASGEKIYKVSNQFETVHDEPKKELYDLFHKYVKKEGYDFNTAGSNVKLFDDADEEYLQGTWKGKHFGREIEVTFEKNHVTIKVDGKVTDDTEYVIYDGSVRQNKLRDGKEKAESEHDYEYFEGVSTFAKKNWFTMTGYFLQESYSTCDLMNFDKEKPEEEN